MNAARAHRSGFTLVEVMIAVLMTAMIVLAIYRFLVIHLVAIASASQHNTELVTMEGLMSALSANLSTLPSPQAQVNGFLGEAHKFNDLPADEMQWIAPAGNSLFTSHAAGDYRVTLRLLPVRGEKTATLGLRRVPALNPKEGEQNWLPLLQKVSALEIRYFDSAQNAWLEKWSDPRGRPTLVRVRIWRQGEEDPHESVIPVSRALAPIGAPGADQPGPGRPGVPRPGGGGPRVNPPGAPTRR